MYYQKNTLQIYFNRIKVEKKEIISTSSNQINQKDQYFYIFYTS